MNPSFPNTTAFTIDGYRITENIGIVRGIIVRSRSIVGNVGAKIQTLFGGNITLYTELCERTRDDRSGRGARGLADPEPVDRRGEPDDFNHKACAWAQRPDVRTLKRGALPVFEPGINNIQTENREPTPFSLMLPLFLSTPER